MSTEVTAFDPSTLMQGVRDRIKSTFVALIPDDKWEQMIQKEINWYFNNMDSDYYKRSVTPFQKTVNEVFAEFTTARVKEFIEKNRSHIWEDGYPKATEALTQILIENAPKMFAEVMGNMVQNVINNTGRY
jgi:hypothetical protein